MAMSIDNAIKSHSSDGLLYLDSLVGTDSHTTMINGLGVLGWGECNCCIV